MATSTIRISTTVNATALVPDPSGSGLKTNAQLNSTLQHTATTANYATGVDAIATEIFNYINGLPAGTKAPAAYTGAGAGYSGTGTATPVSATVSFVHINISVDNVQAPEYTTPRYYATQYRSGLATPASDAVNVVSPSEYLQNFTLGPNDYTSQATLKAALLTQLTQAQVNSGYS